MNGKRINDTLSGVPFRGKLTTAAAIVAGLIFPVVTNAADWTEITYDDIPSEVAERSGALIPLDTASYIYDNLILHFDGIRNAGATAAHDASATTWANLGSLGNSCDATKTAIESPNSKAAAGSWRGNRYQIKGAEFFAVGSPVTLGGEVTLQVFADFDWSKQVASYPGFFGSRTGGDSVAALYFDTRSSSSQGKIYYKTGYSADSSFTGWTGPHATLFFNQSQGRIGLYDGEKIEWNDGGTMSAIPSLSYNIGAQGDSDARRKARAIVADIYSVRVYRKILTDKELAWNKMLDEVRFHDADTNINVIVESNVAGVEATEASGKYMVNGRHTFSAPESVTVAGCVYTPTGYSLEVWDTAASRWGAAERHEGETTFAYTNCLARAKVRLIWNWALQSGVKKYDADSYVQGGLLLNYDGIRNMGLRAPHSMDTTTWANLGSLGRTHDAVCGSVSGNEAGEWVLNGYEFRGANYFTSGGTADFGQYMTAQVVTDSSTAWRNSYKRRWPAPLGCTEADNTFIIYGKSNSYNSNTYYFQSARTSGKSVNIASWNGRFFNVVVSTNTISLSDGETTSSNAAGTFNSNLDNLTMVVGSSKADDNYGARCFAGRIYSARWYNRVLSEAEIAANNDIDQCRFFGATGRSSETDLVEVRSERPEIDLPEAGVYIVRGEESTLSLTASASVTKGDAVFTCAGYRIETWDGALKTWGSPVEGTGTACAISGTTGGANRRVTWLWTKTQALRAATDYDVSDYVQNGLVSHFDGIRNQGADIAHGAAANLHWRNLVTDGPEARLMTLASSVPSGAAAGAWTESGYQFKGKEYYAFTDTFALGGEMTLSMFVDFKHDLSDRVCDYPGFFGAVSADSDNFFVYGYKGLPHLLTFKTTYGTGKYGIQFPGWTTSHISVMFDKAESRFGFNGGGDPQWNTATLKDIPSLSYAIGTAHSSDANKAARMLVGTVHALRLYNRVLSDEELARNRRIDEIRFRGIGDVTVVNGPVGDTGTKGESSTADGVYNIDSAAWTFTAPVVKIDGRSYDPKLLVETYDAATGGWIADTARPVWVESYTVDKTKLTSRIRLTWTWEKNSGFLIILK